MPSSLRHTAARRLAAGLSLRQMARSLDLSAPYLCDIEHNRRGCREDIAAAYRRLTR